MPDVLLINPPIEDFYQTEIRQYPLGLRLLKKSLENSGISAQILNALAISRRKTIPLPRQLRYLRKFYPIGDISPFRLFSQFYHFGMRYEEIAAEAAKLSPRIIGISANFTPYFDSALQVAVSCKTFLPDVPIVMGGHHVTALPESALKNDCVDFVILGEGEIRLPLLVKAIIQNDRTAIRKIDGVAYRDNGKIFINPIAKYVENLDNFVPDPQKLEIAPILTSRGCPKSCNFCSVQKVMGKRLRLRSVDSIISEMKAYADMGVKKFDFEDDNLTLNKNHAQKLFQAIVNNFSSQQIELSAMNGILADTLDKNLIALMKQAGFRTLNLPLVTGSEEIQRKIGRRQNREHFAQVVTWAAKHDMKIIAYLILGLPEDTLDQMIEDIMFLAQMPVLIGPSIFYPPPGSKTYENCIAKNLISGVDFSLYRSTAYSVHTEEFNRIELVTLFRIVRLLNFWKSMPEQTSTKSLKKFDFKIAIDGESLNLECKKSLSELDMALIITRFLLQRKSYLGMKLIRKSETSFLYQLFPYLVSEKIVNMFIQKLKVRDFLGSKVLKELYSSE